MAPPSSGSRCSDALFRCLVASFSTASLVLLARDKQSISQFSSGSVVTTQLKYSYVAGLVFLVYTNGLVAVYTFVVALFSASDVVTTMRRSKFVSWIMFLLDQGLAYLMMAAAAAATEVTYLIDNGNDKTGWDEKCSSYGRFCRSLKISVILSFFSVVLLAVLSIGSAKQLFRQYAKIKLGGKTYASQVVP